MPIVFKTEEERNPTKPVVTPEIIEANKKYNNVENLTLFPSNNNTPETTDKDKGVYVSGTPVEENLTQIVYEEGEEGQLAIQFLEECGLYQKFLLWQGIQEQLKKLRESVAN